MATPDPRSPAQRSQPLFGVETTRCFPGRARRPTAVLGGVRVVVVPTSRTVAVAPAVAAALSAAASGPATSRIGNSQGGALGLRLSADMTPSAVSVIATTASGPVATASTIGFGGGASSPTPDPIGRSTSMIFPGPPLGDRGPVTPASGVVPGVQ